MKANEMMKRFVSDQSGLETVEYAIILGIIVVGTIFAITQIGGWVKNQFTTTNTQIHIPTP